MPKKNSRPKNLLILCFTFLLAAGIYIWFYPLNKGVLEVSANVTPYLITADNISASCALNPCIIKLKTGLHYVKIEKDGYFSDSFSIDIARGKTKNYSSELKKIPSLNVSTAIPSFETSPKKNLPHALENLAISAPTWDQNETNLAFIDKSEEKLKIWGQDENFEVVASLKNVSNDFNLYWSPDNKFLFGVENNNIFLIDVTKAARKKIILGFNPKNVTWLPNSKSLLINDDENSIYKIDPLNAKVTPLAVTFNLGNAVWDINNLLISYAYDSKDNKTTIESFDPETGDKKIIVTKYNFALNKILTDKNKKIYLYNPETESWYELDY